MGVKVEIKKLVLNIDNKEVSLTIEQAIKLKGVLDDIFRKEIIREVVKEYLYQPYYPPFYTNPITWNSNDNNTVYSDNTLSIKLL